MLSRVVSFFGILFSVAKVVNLHFERMKSMARTLLNKGVTIIDEMRISFLHLVCRKFRAVLLIMLESMITYD